MFNPEKAIEIILYLNEKIQNLDFHKLSKLLYFADRLHLERYGRFICNDHYIAMKHGPVPSNIYDLLKSQRGDGKSLYNEYIKNAFSITENYIITSHRKADMLLLSESDEECLDDAIHKYANLSFKELTNLSHDAAWNNADANDEISIESIAATLSNAKELLEYLKEKYQG